MPHIGIKEGHNIPIHVVDCALHGVVRQIEVGLGFVEIPKIVLLLDMVVQGSVPHVWMGHSVDPYVVTVLLGVLPVIQGVVPHMVDVLELVLLLEELQMSVPHMVDVLELILLLDELQMSVPHMVEVLELMLLLEELQSVVPHMDTAFSTTTVEIYNTVVVVVVA